MKIFKNRNKVLFVAMLMWMTANIAQAAERTIGYCPDDVSTGVYPVGVSGQQTYVGAAICFPASQMEAMKGNRITKIRIAVGEGLVNTRVWIRVGSMSNTPVINQLVGAAANGWNEVTLDTPYEIDGSAIYVGYSGRQPYDKLCVWLTGDENPNATFIYDGSSWDDYYGKGWGALCIQAVVEGDNFADNDLAVSSILLDKDFYKVGTDMTAKLTISNQGTKACQKFSYSYQVDDGDIVNKDVNEALDANASYTVQQSISTEALQEGCHTLKVFINRDAGFDDELLSNDTLVQSFLVYEKDYARTLLLEHFTTIRCVNCPYGDNVLARATSGREDYAWVSHHVGYYTDELTVSESSRYLNFGVSGAPMAMLDRTYRLGLSDNASYPPFSIGYNDASYGGELVCAWMDLLKEEPALVGLNVKCGYDNGSRCLTVTVEGECNGIFQSLRPNTCLTIFLTENNVTAKAVQTGTTDGYTHNHVLRAILTDTFGSEIEWDGNTFTYTATTTLDSDWKPSDMTAIAFVSKPYSSNNVADAEVQNTAMARVDGTSGIASLHNDRPNVSIHNGNVAVDEPYDSVSVYASDGSRMPTNGLQHGLYIIKVVKDGVTTTSKLLY